jgi:hypothetical protein
VRVFLYQRKPQTDNEEDLDGEEAERFPDAKFGGNSSRIIDEEGEFSCTRERDNETHDPFPK